VPGERLLDVAGVPLAFWKHRMALQALFPRGIDVLLARGRELIGIPRSGVITLVL
jgi:alpha-D-ribose 1-methylphosphonate 5-triphosphate synthase subunit PhnH